MLATIMPNAKKRILLLVTQADWGGVQSFIVRFAAELKKEGHDVLLAAGGDGELWAEAERRGIRTHRLTHVRRDIHVLEDWMAIREITRLYQSFQPDAIHLNSSKIGVLGSIAASRLSSTVYGLPSTSPRIVYRIGGWSFLEPMAYGKQWIYRAAETWSAKYKDAIITVHPGDEALAKKIGIVPRERIVTVPNGLDVVTFVSRLKTREDARHELGIPKQAFVIGTIANAYPTKALPPYLNVVKRICDEDRNVIAVIIGDGPEFEMLKHTRDRLGLTDRVRLTGHHNDAASLLPAFDIFALPSRKEGMPWTLLEAMAAGLPSVTTDVGACRWMLLDELRGNAGVIVPARDLSAMIDALRQLKNDPDRRARFAHAARRIVTERFSWKETYRGNRDALLPLPRS